MSRKNGTSYSSLRGLTWDKISSWGCIILIVLLLIFGVWVLQVRYLLERDCANLYERNIKLGEYHVSIFAERKCITPESGEPVL